MGSRRRSEAGITYVTVLILLAIFVGGYLGYVYVPPHMDYLKVKTAVKSACVEAYAQRSESFVVRRILEEVSALGMVDRAVLSNGQVEESDTPFLEEQIAVEMEKEPPRVTATVRYDRFIVFPFLGQQRKLSYEITHTEDLSTVKY